MKQNIYDNDQFFQGYEAIRARENNYNNLLEQPNFIALVPNLTDKVVLDIGCGMGDFASYCITNGAKQVTGIDISANMISKAKLRHTHEGLYFKNSAVEDLNIPIGEVDFISSSLAFHYVADFTALMKKISAGLCDEGTLLFSIEHPISTANKGGVDWPVDEAGNLLHFAIDRYQQEGMRTLNWLVDNVIMYHRTLSTILNTLIEHGLQIEKIVEPTPTNEAIEKLPSIQKEFRRPSFLIVRAKKISSNIEGESE